MKKLSILFISFLTVISAFLTSCDEDHYGPAPVDVTANYSNKISNPNPNLVLTYNGDAMNGKSVDFSTVTGETAIYNPQIEMFARFKMKSSFHKTKRII